jgi:hypothetical protein
LRGGKHCQKKEKEKEASTGITQTQPRGQLATNNTEKKNTCKSYLFI